LEVEKKKKEKTQSKIVLGLALQLSALQPFLLATVNSTNVTVNPA
jgi:hypothetical protein